MCEHVLFGEVGGVEECRGQGDWDGVCVDEFGGGVYLWVVFVESEDES